MEKVQFSSNLVTMGRYTLTPDIFNFLENLKYSKGGETQLTDAIEKLNHESQVFVYNFWVEHYDVGN